MDVFDLDGALIHDYERFARSFTTIRAADIREQIDGLYAGRRFWPEPLIGINPRYERGPSIPDLVADGTLHEGCAKVFRLRRDDAVLPLILHRHQAQAIAKAQAGQSLVVTTGTGSGKSLCFFIPTIDAAIRARAAGEARRTRAVVIYPMNALANSQMEELDKFIGQSGLADPPTFARYTGQENRERRQAIADDPPDILLVRTLRERN